jgi:hypothetical protein
MAFQYVHDLQRIGDIPEKDHVIPVRVAAQIETQFRAWPAHLDWPAGEIAALAAKRRSKALGNFAAAALVCNIFGN